MYFFLLYFFFAFPFCIFSFCTAMFSIIYSMHYNDVHVFMFIEIVEGHVTMFTYAHIFPFFAIITVSPMLYYGSVLIY